MYMSIVVSSPCHAPYYDLELRRQIDDLAYMCILHLVRSSKS